MPLIEVIANDRLGRKGESLAPSEHHCALTLMLTLCFLWCWCSPRQVQPGRHRRRPQEAHRSADWYDPGKGELVPASCGKHVLLIHTRKLGG